MKLVTVSWVQFASGARVDLAALGALCHERGVYYVVPVIAAMTLLGGAEAVRRWRSLREAMSHPSDDWRDGR